MGESGVRQGNGRSQRAGGSSFDLVASKLHSPLIRPGTVRRTSLIERLALAGRTGPPLRVARLRAGGRILELGPRELSLTREEASSLLRNAGLTLGEEDVAALHRRTEGWPAGLYLAALYLREGGPLAS